MCWISAAGGEETWSFTGNKGWTPKGLTRTRGLGLVGYRSENRVGTAVFVLNVIPSKEARIEALKGLATLLVAGGYGVLVARSPGVIGREARNRGWKAWGDGFVRISRRTHSKRG